MILLISSNGTQVERFHHNKPYQLSYAQFVNLYIVTTPDESIHYMKQG